MKNLELVFLKKKQALTTSLKVAEYFGKRHDNVMQAIERCKSDVLNFKGVENAESNRRNFAHVENAIIQSSYKDAKGEKRPTATASYSW